jgi:hypothetical protein
MSKSAPLSLLNWPFGDGDQLPQRLLATRRGLACA